MDDILAWPTAFYTGTSLFKLVKLSWRFKFLTELTKVNPTHVKTIKQVQRLASTIIVAKKTAAIARPRLRKSSSEITWKEGK